MRKSIRLQLPARTKLGFGLIHRLQEGIRRNGLRASGDHRILLSYLDGVVQGYTREFGEAGAEAFFDTTDGWGMAVLDDRAAPLYPRAQALTPQERALTDRLLAQVHQRQ